MGILYVELTNNYTDDGSFQLRGRTHGCGCCSNDIEEVSRSKAISVLDEWEKELRDKLDRIATMRVDVLVQLQDREDQ